MALFTFVCMHPDLGNPDDAHPLHKNLGIIKAAGDCCGRVMLMWHRGIGDWEIPHGPTPLICISYRNTLCWAPITELGGTFLSRYKIHISRFIHTKLEKPTKKIYDNPLVMMVLSMYKDMNKEKRKEFINTSLFKNSILAGHICCICYDYAATIKKCIHIDCCGCCEKCYATPLLKSCQKDGGGANTLDTVRVCPACKQKQEKKCPICLEMKVPQELCVIGCHHAFCWKCYGMGVMKGNKLTTCPLCRAIITNVIDN